MRESTAFTVMSLVLILLAGSAGAQEGAPVAEPEGQGYLQACDTFGSGYLKVAGTATCLKADGYVRAEYVGREKKGGEEDRSFRYRTRLNLDAQNETDYGTLSSALRLQADGRSGTERGNVRIDHALIKFAGFQVGYSRSYFVTHHKDGWQKAANDGFYSDSRVNLLDYTWSNGGFSTTIGVQDSIGQDSDFGQGPSTPQFYGGAAYKTSWGRFAASLGQDALTDGTAAKISMQLEPMEGLNLHGWYARDFGGTRFLFGNYSDSTTNGINTKWEWGVDADYQVTDKFLIWVGMTNADSPEGAPSMDLLKTGVGLRYWLTPHLTVRPEVIFAEGYTEYRFRVLRAF